MESVFVESDDGLAFENSQENAVVTRRIERCHNFYELYERGEDALQSSHKNIEVFFAQRKQDGLLAMVKLRHKLHNDEEVEWVDKMEFVLNLPESSFVAQPFEILEDDAAYYVITERVPG